MRSTCTCGGIAPGYPYHEPNCGKPETDPVEDAYWASLLKDADAR